MKALMIAACALVLGGCQTVSLQGTNPDVVSAKAVSLIKEKGCLAKGDSRCYDLNVARLETNLPWLNQQLQQLMVEKEIPLNAAEAVRNTRAELQDYPADAASSQIELMYRQNYIGQRGAVAMFQEEGYSYTGGAHGYGSTTYSNFDLAAGKKISVQDVVQPGAQAALAAKLTEIYRQHDAMRDLDEAQRREFMRDWAGEIQQSFAATDNFTFAANGIVFSFPPYAIGPYAFGQVDLLLPYHEARGLVQQRWLPQ